MAGVNPHHFLRRLASLLPRTPSCRFASTAVQLQYDSDYDEDSDQERHLALADKCGNAEGRDVRWVFIGSPGIQKHVYASRISKLLDVPYISIGSLVRQELHPRSSLYKKVRSYSIAMDSLKNRYFSYFFFFRVYDLLRLNFQSWLFDHPGFNGLLW